MHHFLTDNNKAQAYYLIHCSMLYVCNSVCLRGIGGVAVKVWGLVLEVSPLSDLLTAACPWLGVWLCLMMQPHNLPFDQALLIKAKHTPKVPLTVQVHWLAYSNQFYTL